MTFIVHGATGAQGSPVLSALIAAGAQAQAAVRNTASVPEGVDAVSVDLADVDSLAAAYAGAEGVFIHLPIGGPDQLAAHARTIADAVATAKPKRVVISTSGQIVDDPTSPLQASDDSPIMTLIRGVEASGVSTAVVAPRLYLENLLLPMVSGPARESGVLPYPLPESYEVSWSSHLDVADVAVKLLLDPTITGTVAVGHLPGLTGSDLADGFAERLGSQVRYEALTPEAFGELIVPMFGAEATAPIVGLYQALGAQENNLIGADNSAQHRLGLTPRSVTDWLAEVSA